MKPVSLGVVEVRAVGKPGKRGGVVAVAVVDVDASGIKTEKRKEG